MAIIKTENVNVSGKRFVRKIKCDSEGNFTCDLPEEVKIALEGTGLIVGTHGELRDCVDAWTSCIEEYNLLNTSTKKVICFSFDDEPGFAEGISLAVGAEVFTETCLEHPDGRANYSYEIEKSSLPDEITNKFDCGYHGERYENQIPWDEKSENFFVDLSVAMTTLKGKLEDLSETKTALKLINKGAAKMLENSKR